MPLGIGSGLWAYIQPSETTNLVTNPSGEFGTQGWGTWIGGTVGTTSQFQQYGAWSGSVAPSSNGTAGVWIETFTLSNGSSYGVACSVLGAVGIPYNILITDNGGVNIKGSVGFTGGGTWQRYGFNYGPDVGGGIRKLFIRKASSADTSAFYFDGAQVELGSITTYVDGDQPGCLWTGSPHQSTSVRSGQYRGGGSVIALADIGLAVDQMIGVGMPPIEDSNQSYAIVDGAQFQRQRAAARHFTLTAKPIVGTSLADFHITRRTIIDAFKPDLVTPQQPVRFMYVGGQGTIQIDAYYEKGLELGNMDGIIAENAAISFAAYDPYWYSPTQQGTTLAPRTNLGSVNYIARRDPLGKWGTMGVAGTTVRGGVTAVQAIAINGGGTVFVGGNFGTAGGTFATAIAMYFPTSNLWGTLGVGSITGAGSVAALAISPAGSIYVGGLFSAVAGTTGAFNIAQWNGAWGTLTGGSITPASGHQVESLLWTSGTLFVGGTFSGVGGTATKSMGQWVNGVWGTMTGGTVALDVYAMARGLDGRIFVGGIFIQAGGTSAHGIAFWNGVWGTLTGGTPTTSSISGLSVAPNGVLYASGQFTGIDTSTYNNIAAWNGIAYSPLASGLTATGAYVWTVNASPDDNSVLAGGLFSTAGGVTLNDGLAQWNGYTWLPSDINLTGIGTVYTIARANDTSIYIGGNFNGTANAASVGTIVNTGRAQVYPTLRMRNLSSGTARVYQLLNTLTNTNIYFNTVLQAGEEADLVLTPGDRSYQSSYRGNIFGQILPGSNLATWSLLPGTNYVSFFADNDSLEASLFWAPRGWSIDSGTIS